MDTPSILYNTYISSSPVSFSGSISITFFEVPLNEMSAAEHMPAEKSDWRVMIVNIYFSLDIASLFGDDLGDDVLPSGGLVYRVTKNGIEILSLPARIECLEGRVIVIDRDLGHFPGICSHFFYLL